jgi:hypothetical protein
VEEMRLLLLEFNSRWEGVGRFCLILEARERERGEGGVGRMELREGGIGNSVGLSKKDDVLDVVVVVAAGSGGGAVAITVPNSVAPSSLSLSIFSRGEVDVPVPLGPEPGVDR